MKSKFRRVVLSVLSFIMILQAVLIEPVYAISDSNDFRSEFINIKKGQSVTDIDVNEITMEDLRMLGIFLSNFYVPLGTVLDEDDETGTVEAMTSALTDVCGLDDSVALPLATACFKASLSTCKPLYYEIPYGANYTKTLCTTDNDCRIVKAFDGVSALLGTDGGKTSKIEDIRVYGKGSWYQIQNCTRSKDGGLLPTPHTNAKLDPYSTCYMYKPTEALKSLTRLPDGSKALPEGIARMTYGNMLTFGRNDCNVKCFWDDTQEPGKEGKDDRYAFSTSDVSLSAIGLSHESIGYNVGYGGNLLSLDDKEWTDADDDVKSKALMPTAQLYVDWVGNIIVDDGDKRLVVLPACDNPYSWSKIGGEGGKLMNLINTKGIRAVQDNQVTLDESTISSITVDTSTGLYSMDKYRTTYGSNKEYKVTEYFFKVPFIDINVGESEENAKKNKAINELFDCSGESCIKFPNWKTRVKSGELKKKNIKAFVDYVMIDTIGEYEYKDGSDSSIHRQSIQNPSNGETLSAKYDVKFGKISKGATLKVTNEDSATLTMVYLTYMFAYSNYLTGATEYDETNHIVDMQFNGDAFPTDWSNNIDWSGVEEAMEEEAKDQMSGEVLSMIYYILHPAKGFKYVSVWAKQKISAFLLGWHEDMVGASTSNTSTGMTTYIGFTGYTTLPGLEDMSWTNWLLENYNNLIVYLIIIIAVILCCYVVIGSLTFQRAVLGLLMFGVLVFVPPVAINACVGVVNQTCDAIYGSKFVYWALVQHQSFYQDLYSALNNENDDGEYAQLVMRQQVSYANMDKVSSSAIEQTNNGYASVKLKWMSPKKDNYLAGIVKDIDEAVENNKEAGNKKPEEEDDETKKKGEDGEDDESEDEESGESVEVGTTTPDDVLTNFGYGMFSKISSGEEFLDEPDALYLYRDYMNLSLYATKSYNLYSTYYGGSESGTNTVDIANGEYRLQVGSHWTGTDTNKALKYSSGIPINNMIFANYEVSSGTYPSSSEFKELSSVSAIRKGFLINTLAHTYSDTNVKMDYYKENNLATNYLLNFTKAYSDIENAYAQLQSDIENNNVKIDKDYLSGYGLPQSYFNFTQLDLDTSSAEGYSKDKLDYFYYGMYSESPFYFFNYNVYDQMNALTGYTYSKDSGTSENFKDLLLGNNLEYFFNYSKNAGDGYGELRDFMNMHDLFYYVVPLMKKGVDLVELYDRAYGMPLYEDIKVTFTADGNVQVIKGGKRVIVNDLRSPDGSIVDGISSEGQPYSELVEGWTEEEVYKFWHNYNVITIFNAYCTWVDTMYDCKYAKPETINIGGKKKTVSDPLDPTSYYATPVYKTDGTGRIVEDAKGEPITIDYKYDGRPMVFSKSEMKYYGLQWNDLTTVEQKIINVQDSVYETSIDLMNYYTFDDNVLATAFAMTQLFEFNKEFSQNSFIGKSYVMYPQSYELKAFTYDAYLRLIISNTTGDNLQVESAESLYQRTMKNSSITFGILLIILDVICVYLIPAFKVFFLVILFLMSIVMIIASAVKIELNIIEVTWKSLLRPLLSFCAITVGLAFIVSLFLSNGAKGVTGDLTPSIQLGDPTMVTAVMICINACALYLYWKVGKTVTQDFVKYAKAVANNIGGSVMGALKTIGGVALASTAINALRDRDSASARGTGAGGRSGSNGKPEPIRNGGTSGSGGSGGQGGQGGGDGDTPSKTRDSQDPLIRKPDNEKDGGNSTNSYEEKVKAGKEKRDGDTGDTGAGVATAAGVGAVAGASAMSNGTDGVKKMTAREKSNAYKTRAKEQRGNIDSIESIGEDVYGNKVGTGGRLATARLKVSEKKNKVMGSLYGKQADMQDKVRSTSERAKKGVANKYNGAVSSIRKSKAGRTVSGARQKLYNTRREYNTAIRSANSSTQSSMDRINQQRKDSVKKGTKAVGNGAKNVAKGTGRLAKGAGRTISTVSRRTVVKGAK